MLSFACRRFRADFTPGARHPHRETCPACAAYAAALERAASVPKLPLPARLRGELRSVLPFVRHDKPRLPVPQVPLPAGLKNRLRAIPRESRREPPAWVRSSRWSVAASYFLTVVLLYSVGDPVALGRRASNAVTRSWTQAWTEVRDERLPRIESAVAGRYGAAVSSVESTLDTWRSEAREVSSKLSLQPLIDRVKGSR